MKRVWKLLLAPLALIMLLGLQSANAAVIYNFSVNLTNGATVAGALPTTGIVTGTIDLPFVSPGGSGSGAARSLVLTSIPAGLDNVQLNGAAVIPVVTSWEHQVANSFTVTNGAVTSFYFGADTCNISCTPVGYLFEMNNTSNTATDGNRLFLADIVSLDNEGGYADAYSPVVTFTPVPSFFSSWCYANGR